MSDKPRRPQVVKMPKAAKHDPAKATKKDIRQPRAQPDLSLLTAVDDEVAQKRVELDDIAARLTPEPMGATKRRFSFGKLLLIAAGGLLSLAIGLTIDQLLGELFSGSIWLGWFATGLTIMLVVAAVAIVAREIAGFMRARKIDSLRATAIETLRDNDAKSAARLVDQLMQLYAGRPDTARGRAKMATYYDEIIDGADLIGLAERDLLAPLDARARSLVLGAAKRVSVVTAVSPRAIVDIAYVAIENIRLMRQLAELYGGRPGTIGIARLARKVIAHLAVTGSIALGDSLIQQFVGHGLVARLSSRLGEGMINGLLTARVGISAIDICRPLPFCTQTRPGIGDFISELMSFSGSGSGTERKQPS